MVIGIKRIDIMLKGFRLQHWLLRYGITGSDAQTDQGQAGNNRFGFKSQDHFLYGLQYQFVLNYFSCHYSTAASHYYEE